MRGEWQLLVVAKAPVPGRAKTRLAASVGDQAAARVAAASLTDVLSVGAATVAQPRRLLALDGDLAQATGSEGLTRAVAGWRVVAQEGDGLGARLAHAHLAAGDGPSVQVGMDTPQITPELLSEVAGGLRDADAVLAPAEDGGWWALALRDPQSARVLAGVPMSLPITGQLTAQALVDAGLRVAPGPLLRDVDTAEDADAVAPEAAGSRFAAVWAEVDR